MATSRSRKKVGPAAPKRPARKRSLPTTGRRSSIRTVLIANRGEIALRILRACRAMDLSPIMVYSEVDRDSLPVRLADAAYPIGAAPATSSYLDVDAILSVARKARADAIHPGYGFLAENADFAEQVSRAGLVFIGPPHAAMRLVGDKVEARRHMARAGIPVTPGMSERAEGIDSIRAFVHEAGYPILLKAAAGGGGKGMRVVRRDSELEPSVRAARSEAGVSFGDDGIYAEKFLERVRHIEVQILADRHGNVVHLGERECSTQRRHQKLIEEAPSAALDAASRGTIGSIAVEVVRTCGYENAGTIEFLLDRSGTPFFMEVNARLQVEHPVTECVTGRDLVRDQIEIARGERLDLDQGRLNPRGWAIECRILAEDPLNGFCPSPGRIVAIRYPAGPGVRVDTALQAGDEISLHYDPLIAKLITWGRNREEAIVRMQGALDEFLIAGVHTTIDFHRAILAEPSFRAGRLDIGYVDRVLPGIAERLREVGPDAEIAAMAAAIAASEEATRSAHVARSGSLDPWTMAGRRSMIDSRFIRSPRA